MTTPIVITRPNKSVILTSNNNNTQKVLPPPPQNNAAYTSSILLNQALSPNSPPMSPNVLVPRAPVVHFFICDYGNAKVKSISDHFIDLLVSNGIKVFTERYATHQAGFQVRAASLNSNADFFFQIHSKTAGRGHVRLYFGGQPKRMTVEESVCDVWSWWRLMCGSISNTESEVLSSEKLKYALKVFANIDSDILNIDALQAEIRAAVDNHSISSELLQSVLSAQTMINEGRGLVQAQKVMRIEWSREPGALLTRCVQMPVIRGLSQPLKDLLLSVLDQTFSKLQRLENIVRKYRVSTPPPPEPTLPVDSGPEVEIPIDGQQPGLSWGALLESVKDESYGMNHITSYGDMNQQGSFRQPFLIDEF
ncbi:hypothetical protein TVAG_151270 [Trichomonas vaginalis G3]|uniref:Uncharacterized protein n=1 Tax=Trichomonas vaginalis (strain ATCC PRA-98 / G3) TaxID=412133 RepID=A2EQC4_TRIV3|nr:hypothetical protein TVAGG3_0726620 [Trichomonas vaginalis G3]EAY05140.1 hypothetical protein TVAG_151270 [Trichomonas vaginalis G3]KAI5510953.1 hypothetical protein TVAGG3_0726620 [Trichomonas vaginalis G3]|eukprot:XP_001317363.1 hypothetical protein [Trichomonas vaginalis G3]